MYDVDGDGVNDVLVFTYNGEIVVFSNDGTLLSDYCLKIPPLKLNKDWMGNISDINVDVISTKYLNDKPEKLMGWTQALNDALHATTAKQQDVYDADFDMRKVHGFSSDLTDEAIMSYEVMF